MVERSEVLPPTNELTAAHGSRLFILSYRYSQGVDTVQENLFHYIKAVHPDWHMTQELMETIAERVTAPILSIVSGPTTNGEVFPHTRIGDKGVANELRISLPQMRRVLNGAVPNEREVTRELAQQLLDRDEKFLFRKDSETGQTVGRPGKPPFELGKSVSPFADPFLSHICHYGFHAHSAGAPEFDRLFATIAAGFKGKGDTSLSVLLAPMRSQLELLVRQYNKYHPHTPVAFPTLI